MRQELNQIEEIEKYLTGKFNSTAAAAFEAEMLTNDGLREQVNAQKLVQQAALRKAIRADVLMYGAGVTGGWSTNWSLLKKFSIFGTGLLILAILFGSYFWTNNPTNEKMVNVSENNTS